MEMNIIYKLYALNRKSQWIVSKKKMFLLTDVLIHKLRINDEYPIYRDNHQVRIARTFSVRTIANTFPSLHPSGSPSVYRTPGTSMHIPT